MDIWNDLMDQDFTKNVEWPEAFGDRICVLNLRNRYQSGPESKAAIKMMRRSNHFESVERDRKILVNTVLNSFSTSSDRIDDSLSPLDLILPSQGDGLI
jgi:hypothetical protein